MGRGKYQVMPGLSAEEYVGLRDSISQYGVQSPIIVDENGVIIDGHNRKRVADELLQMCPEIVRTGLSDEDKRTLAYSLNTERRQLTREQKLALVDESLQADPQVADSKHAERCGVHRNKVSERREALGIGSASEVRRERIRAYAAEHGYGLPGGPSLRDVGKALGVDHVTVMGALESGEKCQTWQNSPSDEPDDTPEPNPAPEPQPQPERKKRQSKEKTAIEYARGIREQVSALTSALEKLYDRDEYKADPAPIDDILNDAIENLMMTIEEKE